MRRYIFLLSFHLRLINFLCLLYFKYNDVTIVKVVLSDKDCAEMLAVEAVFINAKLLLCHFHVLQAVKRRMDVAKYKARMMQDWYDEIMSMFRTAMYTNSEEELDACSVELSRIGIS